MFFKAIVFFVLVVANISTAVLPEQILLEEEGVSILHLGDTMLGRHVGEKIEEGLDPFQFVHEKLKQYDVVVANLEGPITEGGKCQIKPYSFKFATTTAYLLAHHNIHGVSLANNHSYDCFSKGLIDTRKYLSEKNIFYFGGGLIKDSYTVQTIEGEEVVFVGIDMTIGEIAIENFYTLIQKLNKTHEIIVVHIHSGNEYETNFSKVQQSVAHNLIDRGVDVIIGHHPHVMQPVEIYKEKPIFYSLGNFIFDQNGEETTKGYGVAMEIFDNKIVYKVLPYRILHTQPTFLDTEKKESTCKKILGEIKTNNKCSIVIQH